LLGIFAVHVSTRVLELERRVAVLSAQPGAARAAQKSAASARGATPSGKAPIEKRLDAIEDDLAQLQEDYAGLDDQLAQGGGPTGTPDEEHILDVVTRAQNRVRDRQLEFHLQHWKRTRAQLLEQFAAQTKLERWQTDELREMLDEELDAMLEIFTQQEMLENPEVAADEWQRRLDATDLEAVRLLDPEQKRDWLAARAHERAVLWPWLPSLQKKDKR
jgi:hypothetical protein